MGSDARIDQLEGRSPESCPSWLRSHKGYPTWRKLTVKTFLLIVLDKSGKDACGATCPCMGELLLFPVGDSKSDCLLNPSNVIIASA